MDWQSFMTGLESWLWDTPFFDLPNHVWVSIGLGILVLVLYLVLVFTRPEEAELEESEEAEPPLPSPEEAVAAHEEVPPPDAAPPMEGVSGLTVEPQPEKIPAKAPPEAEEKLPPAPETAVPEETVEEAKAEVPAPEVPIPEEAVPEAVPPEEVELEPPEGWLSRLRNGLTKTQDKFTKGLTRILSGKKIDTDTLDELEELLITSDLGVKTSMKLLEGLNEQVSKEGIEDGDRIRDILKNEIEGILEKVEEPLAIPDDHKGPFVIMVTGVNGTGKTTTIGKLAMRFQQEGKSVLIGAADTFRAAAIEQLEIWGKRSGTPVIKHKEGADPSAVAFDAVKAAESREADVLIIDTAGRLHTKHNLMEELKKVKRITGRELEGAPHETILVLDATTGQNAVQQAKTFSQALQISGLVLTKLDGTAKGGIIVAISDEFGIPIRFIGVGEKIYDLQPFRAQEFVEALF